jgi:hypothetical protein
MPFWAVILLASIAGLVFGILVCYAVFIVYMSKVFRDV